MSNEHKRRTKSVDLPPRGARNRDPITKEAGAHPVEVGVGTALVGSAAGLAAGSLAGPVGAVVGAVVGGVAGGYGGKALGEAIDATTKAKSRPAKSAPARRPAKARASRPKTGAAAGAQGGEDQAGGRGHPGRREHPRERGPQDRARLSGILWQLFRPGRSDGRGREAQRRVEGALRGQPHIGTGARESRDR